ncbi:MAG: GC-type dockerin domain-anchored protein, partial [Phycisphaerales bacterium]
ETAFQSTGQQDIHFLRSGLNGETGCFEGPAFAAVAPIPLLQRPLGMARVPETLTSPVEMFVQDVPLNNIRFCFSEGCPADFNHDNAVDGDDVIAFFGLWDQGLPCADVTGDNAVDGDDVIFFFFRWDAGC